MYWCICCILVCNIEMGYSNLTEFSLISCCRALVVRPHLVNFKPKISALQRRARTNLPDIFQYVTSMCVYIIRACLPDLAVLGYELRLVRAFESLTRQDH